MIRRTILCLLGIVFLPSLLWGQTELLPLQVVLPGESSIEGPLLQPEKVETLPQPKEEKNKKEELETTQVASGPGLIAFPNYLLFPDGPQDWGNNNRASRDNIGLDGIRQPYSLGAMFTPFPDPNPPVNGGNRDYSDLAFRFGWWAIDTNGSQVKTGEYQSLQSSPFFDLDGLFSDGVRTYDFYGNFLDPESGQTGLEFFGPHLHADLGYQQFIHQLDHVPLDNFKGATGFRSEDMNVGEDYAIRVQEFNGDINSRLTDNIKFGVHVWDMRKFGERQANATAHCFQSKGVAGRSCHVLSQRQMIDWNTTEVTPSLEGQFGAFNIRYSRPMRQFTQNDEVVTRNYTGSAPSMIVGEFPYAVVPESTTQIDKLQIGADLTKTTRFYGFGYFGQTENTFRDVRRDFGGYDFRLTDSTLDGVTLTAYTKSYHQNGIRPDTLLFSETQFLTPQQAEDRIRDPIEFHRTNAGLKGRWAPGFSNPMFHRLAFIGGYDYNILERDYAIYKSKDADFEFFQQGSITNTVHAGVQQYWGPTVDTYARYKILFVDNPLYGFREGNGVVNSGQPEQRHILDIGGGWYPLYNLALSGQQEFDLSRHYADISIVPDNIVQFHEESYATTLTLWYAPMEKLSLTGSVAFLSNWIDQNITVGDDYVAPDAPPGDKNLQPETRMWNYGGNSTVFTLRSKYQWLDTVWLTGGYEYVRGKNQFNANGFADLWPDLPLYSDVKVETQRVIGGVDWRPADRANVFLRYIFFDYNDLATARNSGTAHMFFGGFASVY